MISLTINGIEVQGKPGSTILEVADANGIRIPRLCHHASLNAIGCCRLCVVDVKPGPPKPVPACTTQIADKMQVTTHTEQIDRYRRELLQLILMNHVLDCPICDKGGECELQNLTRELKIKDQQFQAVKLVPEYDDRSPLIERYPDRCVNCERCIRVCRERVGAGALYFNNRGYRTVVTAGAKTMSCEHCGSCVAVCPTGALIDKGFKYEARAWELDRQAAICSYCGGGCHVVLNTRKGELKRVTSSKDEPVNGILICSRGRFSLDALQHPQRLTEPMIRKNGALEPVSWQEALEFVAGKVRELVKSHGPEAIAGVGSPRSSNEANYLFQKMCRLAIGTPNIDSTASLDHQKLLRAFVQVLGAPEILYGPDSGSAEKKINELRGFQLGLGCLDDLRQADMVLVVGADVKKEMPPYAWAINRGRLEKQLKNLCVVSSRKTRFRSKAQINAYCKPGSSGYVLVGILKAFLADSSIKKGQPLEYAQKQKFHKHLDSIPWTEIEAASGIRMAECRDIALALKEASNPSLILGLDLSGVVGGEDLARYVADLMLVFGRKLKVHLTAEKANTQGCSDMGVAPDWLPGYVSPQDAANIEAAWGKAVPKSNGLSLRETMLAAAGEGPSAIRGLLVLGSDLLASLPDRDLTEKALGNLDLLVCQDVFLNETAARAHCVLPAFGSLETPGTLTSTELRVQAQKGTAFVQGPKPDWAIIQDLSNQLGYAMRYNGAAEIFDEIRRVFPYYDQASFEDLEGEGFWWNRLHLSKLGSTSWKRKLNPSLIPVTPGLPAAAKTNDRYPFMLHIGKSLFQSGTMSRYGWGSSKLEEEGKVWMNPDDALSLGIAEGDRVSVISEKGALSAPVGLDRRVASGVVQATAHFSDLQIHRLTRDGNMASVRIEKVKEG